jgi:enoyl-[acyl-carrier protein] reductase I
MILKEKKIFITGIANHRSIAWSIAVACIEYGAKIAISYHPKMEEKVKKLLEKKMPDVFAVPMDATDEDDVKKAYEQVDNYFNGNGIDGMVHAIAFARKKDIEDKFYTIDKEGFNIALTVSAYSLILLSRHAKPLMEKNNGGSIITLTYVGSEKVIGNYNIMGVAKAALESSVRYLAYDLGELNIRVNAVSAGPIATLSARGVKDFTSLYYKVKDIAPLKRNVEAMEVGKTGAFLLSDMSSGITGNINFVDCGQNIVGTF